MEMMGQVFKLLCAVAHTWRQLILKQMWTRTEDLFYLLFLSPKQHLCYRVTFLWIFLRIKTSKSQSLSLFATKKVFFSRSSNNKKRKSTIIMFDAWEYCASFVKRWILDLALILYYFKMALVTLIPFFLFVCLEERYLTRPGQWCWK